MPDRSDLAARVADLERQLEDLRNQRSDALAEGAMLKAMLDDIAKRREVERRLTQAQEWLHLSQEAGRVAAYTFDMTTGRLEWSASTMALYGFDPTQEPSIEQWLGAIHPEDRDSARAVAEAALAGDAEVKHRFRIVRPDGSVAWVEDRGRLLLDDAGRPERLVGINIDVTELIELQRRTAENEERLRLALEAEKQACWDWNIATGQVTWDENLGRNVGLEAGFGGSFEAFWALVYEEDKEQVRGALDAALAGESDYAVEFRMQRPDGSLRWTATRAVVVRDADGRPLRMVGVDADITQRKRTEAALLQQERFLQSVLDASADCIKVIEADGALTYMNLNGQCAMEITDFSQVAGRRWDELWPEDGAPLVRRAMDLARAGESTRFEAFCPTAAGTPKWWEVSVAPIFSEGSDVARIASISRDVTARREAEERLRLLNAELHHRVKNTMAMVQAIARATLRSAHTPEAFEQSFSARIEALAKTYSLLRAESDSAIVGDLIRTELEPFGRAANLIEMDGPEILLPAAAAVSFGMIMHELATNAAKYGSLSRKDGAIRVAWQVTATEASRTLVTEWIETDGPQVQAPARTGFGSKLIGRLVGQLNGRINRRWDETGLTVALTIPLP